MNAKRRLFYIVTGPIILIITTLLLSNILTTHGAQAVGVMFWMIYWWITRPVHITVTGIIPVVANALLDIAPMSSITAPYVSDSIILIFGSGLMCLPWASIGLDRRIALKTLSIVGPSMKSQITVWLIASIALSTILPNVMVCALFTPIAVSMLAAAGYDDIPTCAPAVPILLAIGWGVGIGGSGSPLGGAMNLVAITYLEEFTGQEFMYVDWVIRIAPYLIIATIVLLVGMLLIPMEVKYLNGTKDYFEKSYRELGPMKRDEKICSVLFIIAMIGVFARPLYDDILPAFAPAYIFLLFGFISFFITTADKKMLLNWETAEKNTMWGMMILFGGGLSLGKLINESGASTSIATIFSNMNLDGGLTTVIVIVVFARIISELTNGTTAAAIIIPIIFGFTTKLGLNPIPYWFITTMAYNAEFVLPISVRAIPVAYGLDANKMMKDGFPQTVINMIVVIIVGYIAMQLWPTFGQLSYIIK